LIFGLIVRKPLPEAGCLLLLSRLGGNLLSLEPASGEVERRGERREVFVGMKTDKMKVLGSAVLLALFTSACASDDAAGAPPTVIIDRDRGSSPPVIIERDSDDDKPVIIERESDKDLEVDVDVDKE
jgi:hypothetical protein